MDGNDELIRKRAALSQKYLELQIEVLNIESDIQSIASGDDLEQLSLAARRFYLGEKMRKKLDLETDLAILAIYMKEIPSLASLDRNSPYQMKLLDEALAANKASRRYFN